MSSKGKLAAVLLELYASGKITKQFVYKVAKLLSLKAFHGKRIAGV